MDPLSKNQMPQAQAPQQPAQPVMTTPPPQMPSMNMGGGHRTSWGAIIGIIIVLAILVIAALFFWGKSQLTTDTDPLVPQAVDQQSQSTQQTDASLAEIEASLNSINTANTAEIDSLGQ